MGKIIELTDAAALGRAIRDARKQHGLTLADCAAANGVSMRFLSELERGKQGASLGLALRIARSVGLQIRAEATG